MKRALSLAYLAALAAGAEVCGRVPDCVIDVGRACAKKHLPSRNERAAAAKVVAARNAYEVDDDGCYKKNEDYPDIWRDPHAAMALWVPAGRHRREIIDYLSCVETSEAAEDMSEHGQACDDVCENMFPADIYKDDLELTRLHCSLKLGCLARNEAYYYDPSADVAAEIECVGLSDEACAEATLAATEGTEPVTIGPLRNATVGDECRAEFAHDEPFYLGENPASCLYAGEARETARKIMQNVWSKDARRLKRLQEEALSSRKAAGEL